METRHSNVRLSIYGMEDVPAFMIKGYAHAFMMGDEMEDVSTFVIKGDVP
jgi:hypothetical protein